MVQAPLKNRALRRLRGDTFFGISKGIHVDFTGAKPKFIQESLDELNNLVELYPEAATKLKSITVKNQETDAYHLENGGARFNAYAAALSDRNGESIVELWLSERHLRTGRLSKAEMKADSGRSVSTPVLGSDLINFQALIAHEYGHSLHRWLDNQGFSEHIKLWINIAIEENFEDLYDLTGSSFDLYSEQKQYREIFAELFASFRVIDLLQKGLIDQSKFHPKLDEASTVSIIQSFKEMVDELISTYGNR